MFFPGLQEHELAHTFESGRSTQKMGLGSTANSIEVKLKYFFFFFWSPLTVPGDNIWAL